MTEFVLFKLSLTNTKKELDYGITLFNYHVKGGNFWSYPSFIKAESMTDLSYRKFFNSLAERPIKIKEILFSSKDVILRPQDKVKIFSSNAEGIKREIEFPMTTEYSSIKEPGINVIDGHFGMQMNLKYNRNIIVTITGEQLTKKVADKISSYDLLKGTTEG